MSEKLVGVFGTLRQGESRGGVMDAEGVRYVGTVQVHNAVLINLGSFPTISFLSEPMKVLKDVGYIPSSCSDTVEVEVYDVSDTLRYGDQFMEEVLHPIEGFPHMYGLSWAKCETEDGGTDLVPVYCVNPRDHHDWISGGQLILSGDWLNRAEQVEMPRHLMRYLHANYDAALLSKKVAAKYLGVASTAKSSVYESPNVTSTISTGTDAQTE